MNATTINAAARNIFSSLGRRKLARWRNHHHFYRKQASRSALAFSSSSSSSSSSDWITVEYPERDEGKVAVLTMHRGPANALSLEFCAQLSEAIRGIEETQTTTTIVLASSLPNIFSAGLDISRELYQPDPDRLPEFWWHVQQVFLDLYSTRLTTVAAVGGHAPAAGCSLALAADYRCLEGTGKIGFNESQLGIVAPPWMAQQYIDVLGHRRAELALLEGRLFGPQEALELGLVDALVDDAEKSALAKAREFARIPHGARAAVKKLTRTPLVDKLLAERQNDTDHFCNFVTAEPVQAAIGVYLQALQAKGKQ